MTGRPTSSLTPVYTNGMCGTSAFILNNHRESKVPDQKNHAIEWRGTGPLNGTACVEFSSQRKKNQGIDRIKCRC